MTRGLEKIQGGDKIEFARATIHCACTWTKLKLLLPLFVVAALIVLSHAQALHAQTANQCYDPINAQTVGDPSWTGCAGMYIVKDRAELVSATSNGAPYRINFAGIDYTFSDTANNIFTGQVTQMQRLFENDANFNDHIGYWDTSRVENMFGMFSGALEFNRSIENWNTSNVRDMAVMFAGAASFDQNIDNWDTSSVLSMSYMFNGALMFNSTIEAWNTSKVMSMDNMFRGAAQFNQDLSGWDVSSVTSMANMFNQASSFDQNIAAWDTSSVQTMQSMFYFASAFDQDVSAWDVSNVNNFLTFDVATKSSWVSSEKPIWGTNGTRFVTSVNAFTADGTYKIGDTIELDVRFNGKVDAIGFPAIQLETGAVNWFAHTTATSGTNTLRFSFSVLDGHESSDLDYFSTTSLVGSIFEAGTTDLVNLTLPSPGASGSLGSNSNIVIDGVRPTMTASSPATSPVNAKFDVTISLSETLASGSQVDLSGLLISNGSFDGSWTWGSNQSEIAISVTPTNDGPLTIELPAGAITDNAGNTSSATSGLFSTTVALDSDRPTLALSGPSGAVNSTFSVTFTFSEAVIGFDINDIVVANGTASAFDNSTAPSYTANITPDGVGDVTINVPDAAAQDATGNNSVAASQLTIPFDSGRPSVVLSGPTAPAKSDFKVDVEFSEVVAGFEANDVSVTGGTVVASSFVANGKNYSISIVPKFGETVKVSVLENVAFDAANNGNLPSNIFEIQAASPATEFEENKEEVKAIVLGLAQQDLRSETSHSLNILRDARSRFRLSQEQINGVGSGIASRNMIDFDTDGFVEANPNGILTRGTFFQQRGAYNGEYRRLVFGEFDVQTKRGEATTATIRANVAWEHMLSDQTMFGYYIGGQASTSNLQGSFSGSRRGAGLSTGLYGLSELSGRLTADGFATVGIGQNDLDISNDTLRLASNYHTISFMTGGSVSASYELGRFNFLPELSLVHGHTKLGEIGLTGWAYGLVDDGLTLSTGSISSTNLMFRPEFRLAVGSHPEGNASVSISPRVACQSVNSSTACGRGMEVGYSYSSLDGSSSAQFEFAMDEISGDVQSSVRFGLELGW